MNNLKYPDGSMLLTLCPFMPGSPGVPGKPRAPCKGKGAPHSLIISLYCLMGLFQRSCHMYCAFRSMSARYMIVFILCYFDDV